MVMPKGEYEIFEALNPFFEVVMEGLRGLVDGDHYFDTTAEDAFFDFRYHFPGWPLTIQGRANLMARYSGYGKSIRLHSGDSLVVHRSPRFQAALCSALLSARSDTSPHSTLRLPAAPQSCESTALPRAAAQ